MSFSRHLNPVACDGCFKDLQNKKANFFSFQCYEHCICVQCVNSLGRIDEKQCPYCSTQVKRKINVLLPNSPVQISYSTTLRISKRSKSIWRAQQDDTVIIGGFEDPSLTVVTLSGVGLTHAFKKGSWILSGVAVDGNTHLVNIYDHYEKTCTVCTVYLDINISERQSLTPIASLQLDSGTNPFFVCALGQFQFGVHSEGKLDIFALKDLKLCKNPSPIRSIKFASSFYADIVSIDHNSNISLLSNDKGAVFIYNQKGELLQKVGRSGNSCEGGELEHPRSLQCYADGSMILVCHFGEIHRFDGISTWSVIKKRDASRTTHMSVCTKNHVWCKGWDDDHNVYVSEIEQ